MQKMVKFYFSQTEHYMSGSKDELIKIAEMPSVYAANAARRLLLDCSVWGGDAGEANPHGYAQWMLQTPLWNALHRRASGLPPLEEGEAY